MSIAADGEEDDWGAVAKLSASDISVVNIDGTHAAPPGSGPRPGPVSERDLL